MNTTEHVKRSIEQAEEAVSAVKDPNLKRSAFEKVLGWLLQGGHAGSPAPDAPRASAKVKAAPSKPAKAKPSRIQGGPQARVEELIEAGFFKKQRTFADVKKELGTAGFHISKGPLSAVLLRLCQKKVLRRQPGTDKAGYVYSNW